MFPQLIFNCLTFQNVLTHSMWNRKTEAKNKIKTRIVFICCLLFCHHFSLFIVGKWKNIFQQWKTSDQNKIFIYLIFFFFLVSAIHSSFIILWFMNMKMTNEITKMFISFPFLPLGKIFIHIAVLVARITCCYCRCYGLQWEETILCSQFGAWKRIDGCHIFLLNLSVNDWHEWLMISLLNCVPWEWQWYDKMISKQVFWT